MPRAAVYTASTPAQIRTLASPIRLELLSFLCAMGPCTLADLARACDRPADGLYQHVRRLMKHNMVVTVPTTVERSGSPARRGRKASVLFDAAAEHYRPDYDPGTGRGASALQTITAAAFKGALKCVVDAQRCESLVVSGPDRNLGAHSTTAWLTPKQLGTIVAAIDSALVELRRGVGPSRSRPPDAELFHFTYVLAPVSRSRRAAKVKAPNDSQ